MSVGVSFGSKTQRVLRKWARERGRERERGERCGEKPSQEPSERAVNGSPVSSKLLHVKEVGATGGFDGPVVVLAAAIDVGEWLLLKQGRQPEPRCDLVNDLHHSHVLVDLKS